MFATIDGDHGGIDASLAEQGQLDDARRERLCAMLLVEAWRLARKGRPSDDA